MGTLAPWSTPLWNALTVERNFTPLISNTSIEGAVLGGSGVETIGVDGAGVAGDGVDDVGVDGGSSGVGRESFVSTESSTTAASDELSGSGHPRLATIRLARQLCLPPKGQHRNDPVLFPT